MLVVGLLLGAFPFKLIVTMLCHKGGPHPLSRCHAMKIVVAPDFGHELCAWACMHVIQRVDWELAVVSACVYDRHCLQLQRSHPWVGLATSLDRLGAWLSVNTLHLIPTLWSMSYRLCLSFQCPSLPYHLLVYLSFTQLLSGLVQPWVAPLSIRWDAACSWAPVYATSFDYFPVAAALSRSHGRSSW